MTPDLSKPGVEPKTLDSQQQLVYLSTLVQLQHRLRQARTPEELSCILVNDTLQLLPYDQAVFWESTTSGRIRIKAVSGTDQVDANGPYILFLKKILGPLAGNPDKEIRALTAKDVDENLADEWVSWLPQTLLVCPLHQGEDQIFGGLVFMRPSPWKSSEKALLGQMVHTFAHAWQALKRGRPIWLTRMGKRLFRPMRLVLAGLFILMLCLPIHLSVLAPMEIIPRDPVIIAASMDGVVKRFMVAPNEPVEADQVLFVLDDIRIRNEHDIALGALAVTRADELRARQKAFADDDSRAELLMLRARIDQQQTTVDYLAEKLERIRIKSPVQGIVVFTDVNDWLGKPVVVGEKIVTIADPGQVIAQIQLPVADAITLLPGAAIRLFLNIAPDRPIEASLHQAAYEAQLTSDGILAFRLKANLANLHSPPRIGLRGTAKIYGEKVSLFYFLMRRPLAFLRQFIGI